jgi:hypothetical protein
MSNQYLVSVDAIQAQLWWQRSIPLPDKINLICKWCHRRKFGHRRLRSASGLVFLNNLVNINVLKDSKRMTIMKRETSVSVSYGYKQLRLKINLSSGFGKINKRKG